MPEISVTDEQKRRFEDLREAIDAAYGSAYTTVRDRDVVTYLLDTHTPPEDAAEARADADETVTGPNGNDTAGSEAEDEDEGERAEGRADDTSRAASMLQLLDEHDDKWREAEAGERPYEVVLPDGSTEGARTKDDVRRILYQNY